MRRTVGADKVAGDSGFFHRSLTTW